jgi:hypothetical protein
MKQHGTAPREMSAEGYKALIDEVVETLTFKKGQLIMSTYPHFVWEVGMHRAARFADAYFGNCTSGNCCSDRARVTHHGRPDEHR